MKYNIKAAETLSKVYKKVTESDFKEGVEIFKSIKRIKKSDTGWGCLLCDEAIQISKFHFDFCSHCIYNHPAIREKIIDAVCSWQESFMRMIDAVTIPEAKAACHARGEFIDDVLQKIKEYESEVENGKQ